MIENRTESAGDVVERQPCGGRAIILQTDRRCARAPLASVCFVRGSGSRHEAPARSQRHEWRPELPPGSSAVVRIAQGREPGVANLTSIGLGASVGTRARRPAFESPEAGRADDYTVFRADGGEGTAVPASLHARAVSTYFAASSFPCGMGLHWYRVRLFPAAAASPSMWLSARGSSRTCFPCSTRFSKFIV